MIMPTTLQRKFDRLSHSKIELLKRLENQSQEILNRQVVPGRWSSIQVVKHLINVETSVVRYVNKKRLAIETLENTGLSEDFKVFITCIWLRLPTKIKAPEVVAQNLEGSFTLESLLLEWQESSLALEEMVSSIEKQHYRKKLFKHPLIGRINIVQTFSFLQAHFDHHLPQIARQLK